MKFFVPNYSCLQKPWLRGYRPQIPVLSVLCSQLNLLKSPPQKKKFLGTPLLAGLPASQPGTSYGTQTGGWKYVGFGLHSPLLSENAVLNLALGQLYLSYLVRSENHISVPLGHFIEHALRKLGQCFDDNWWNKRCYCLEIICYWQRPRQPLHKGILCRQTLTPGVSTRN